MKINIVFLALLMATLILIASGYFILNPQELGYCLESDSDLHCVGQNFYFGIGKPLYNSLNAFALLFFILIFIPKAHLRYWYRIVLPLGLLGIAIIILSSPVRQNMLDPERVDVARAIGEWLLLLTLAVVGHSLFSELFSNKKSRG
jgi:hypothetical protein